MSRNTSVWGNISAWFWGNETPPPMEGENSETSNSPPNTDESVVTHPPSPSNDTLEQSDAKNSDSTAIYTSTPGTDSGINVSPEMRPNSDAPPSNDQRPEEINQSPNFTDLSERRVNFDVPFETNASPQVHPPSGSSPPSFIDRPTHREYYRGAIPHQYLIPQTPYSSTNPHFETYDRVGPFPFTPIPHRQPDYGWERYPIPPGSPVMERGSMPQTMPHTSYHDTRGYPSGGYEHTPRVSSNFGPYHASHSEMSDSGSYTPPGPFQARPPSAPRGYEPSPRGYPSHDFDRTYSPNAPMHDTYRTGYVTPPTSSSHEEYIQSRTPPPRMSRKKFRPSVSREERVYRDQHHGRPGFVKQLSYSPLKKPSRKTKTRPAPHPRSPPSSPHPDYDSYATSDEEARREVEIWNSQFKQHPYVQPAYDENYKYSGEESENSEEDRSPSPPRVKHTRSRSPQTSSDSDGETPRYDLRSNRSRNFGTTAHNSKQTRKDTPMPKRNKTESQKDAMTRPKGSKSSPPLDTGSDSELDLLGIPSRNTFGTRRTKPREKEPVKYDGKRDVMDYLLYFLNIVELNGWDYETQGLQLSTSLAGDALEILSSLDRSECKDMRALCKALLRKYAPSGGEAQYSYEMMNRTLKNTETVTEYCNALRKLAKKAYPKIGVPEKLMIDLFKKGLPSQNMQMQIHLKNPDTLLAALEIAKAVETFEKPKGLGAGKKPKGETIAPVTGPKSSQTKPNPTSSPPPAATATTPAVPPLLSLPTNPPPQYANSPVQYANPPVQYATPSNRNDQNAYPDIECFYCKAKGHYRSSCGKLRQKLAKEAAQGAGTPSTQTYYAPSQVRLN